MDSGDTDGDQNHATYCDHLQLPGVLNAKCPQNGGFWDSGLRFVVGGFWPARSLDRSLFFHEPAYISIEYVIAFATHNLYIVFR